MTKILALHKKWMKDSEYAKEYDALEGEFALAGAVARARNRRGLSQTELARRMKTTESTRNGQARGSKAVRGRFPAARAEKR